MKSLIVLFTIIFTLALLTPPHTQADVKNCITVFGGGSETCTQPDNIEIDKLILDPISNTFVDNLDKNTPRQPNSTIEFKIIIKNKKANKLNNIKILDTLPTSLEFISASDKGKYDKNKKTVSYEINLDGNQSKELTLTTRTTSNINTDSQCITNQVIADVQWKKGFDNSQFCISKTKTFPTSQAPTSLTQPEVAQTQPGTTKGGKTLYATPANVATNPNTGPEALALIALIPVGISGFLLRKKIK